MLFFFFFSKPYHQVKIKMTFKAPKGQNPSLEELNEFLDSFSKIHEYVILNTQPEEAFHVQNPILNG